ncbi:hypothetical protein ACFXHA_37415 [Nocardia sp. NPDC059240]|uniref:hypothetical protein n=1 Tax=Nocardia sp. NPDC059240 TaxID=3346786 RepID=UPI00368BA28C
MTAPSATVPVSEIELIDRIETDRVAVESTGRLRVLRSLLRNWTVLRAVTLAAATVTLLILRHPTWVPFAVSAYAISNATAITFGAARTA